MKSAALCVVISAATLMNGILASGGINRALVHMPAWRHVGPVGWATFSRYADLGTSAMVLYPLEAFSGMILSLTAAILFWRQGSAPRLARVPIYAAAFFTVGGLLLTLKAAPIMLSVRHVDGDPIALRHAFDGFEFWGGLRSISQVLGYLSNFGSLIAVLRQDTSY